eukprot:4203645-Heterocapsa_arctica.AAC.1
MAMGEEEEDSDLLLQRLIETKQKFADAWKKEKQKKVGAEHGGGSERPTPEAPKEVAKIPEQGKEERPLEERLA